MKKRISLYVRSVLTFLRIVITKIFNIKGFHSAFIQDFSITTKISVNERGKILLKSIYILNVMLFYVQRAELLKSAKGVFSTTAVWRLQKKE